MHERAKGGKPGERRPLSSAWQRDEARKYAHGLVVRSPFAWRNCRNCYYLAHVCLRGCFSVRGYFQIVSTYPIS